MAPAAIRTGRGAGALVLAATLAGCAVAPKPSPVAADLDQQRLYLLPYWKAEGRMGIQSQQQAWNANLSWEHEGHQDRLRLSGPFNQGMVSIILQDRLIYINEGKGAVEATGDIDGALKRRLGFTVPVASLRYWMLGIPAPQGDFSRGEAGATRQLLQQGWTLDFDRYTSFAGTRVPSKSSIRGNGVNLKLVIDRWSATKP
jgi:outer membrane lipoprotein LolB